MLGGERKGPYTLGQMRAMWNAGTLTGDTLYWRDGQSNWEALSTIQGDLESAVQRPSAPMPPPAPQPTQVRQGEQTIFSDEHVTVTTDRVTIQGTTYALRNITSVKADVTTPRSGCASVALCFGFFAALSSIGVLRRGDSETGVVQLFFLGLAPIAVGFFLLTRKPVFHVRIASASGEIKALSSPDEAYIEKIVKSINAAIVKCR